MSTVWMVEGNESRLRLSEPINVRTMASEQFTWAHLLYGKLGSVEVFTIYFPSRFELEQDNIAMDALRVFGKNTPITTSVSFWDPTDPQFTKALGIFRLKSPPAIVLATGLKVNGINPYGPDDSNIYSIVFTESPILADKSKLVSAVNSAYDILVRGDPAELADYLRKKAKASLLSTIGRILGRVRDEFLKFKPKFQLPDGSSIQLGSE